MDEDNEIEVRIKDIEEVIKQIKKMKRKRNLKVIFIPTLGGELTVKDGIISGSKIAFEFLIKLKYI